MPERPKLLIGVPAFAGLIPEVQEDFMRLIFRCGRDLPQYDFAVEIVPKREQFRARNQLCDAAIASGSDYLLMLDDDMVVPPDLVSRLLAHDKEVVGALYWQRGGAFHPVVMQATEQESGEKAARFLEPFDPIITQPGLYPVDIIGGGCMLLKTDVLRKLTPPYFWWEETLGTDIAICLRLKDAGVQVWIDTTLELGHIGDKTIITSRTIPLGMQALGDEKEKLWTDAQTYLCMHASELESAMLQASEPTQRQDRWHAAARDTWEGVCDFYTQYGNWHVLNLLAFAMAKRDQMLEWLHLEAGRYLPQGARILDFGPGLGLAALALATQGYHVTAVDLPGPTFDFLRWRATERGLRQRVDTLDFLDPVPDTPLDTPVQCVLMLSMLEHCWDPHGSLEWAIAQLAPGGWLLCDYLHGTHGADEPQHLMRFDPTTLGTWLQQQGLEQAPEHYWLWRKRGA